MMMSDDGDNLLIMALWLHCHCAGEKMSFGLGSFSFLKDDCDNNNNADDGSWRMLNIRLHCYSVS